MRAYVKGRVNPFLKMDIISLTPEQQAIGEGEGELGESMVRLFASDSMHL